MTPEIILFVSFMVVVNLALNLDEKRQKKRRKSLTIPHNHAKVKK